MLNKKEVYKETSAILKTKIGAIQSAFDDLNTAVISDSKSTAGDKHETGRAMLHLEQEKLSRQLEQLNQMKEALSKIDPSLKHEKIQFGSIVYCSTGYFFVSIGLGEIQVEENKIYCLTPLSPLGKSFIGKSVGESIVLNNRSIEIYEIT